MKSYLVSLIAFTALIVTSCSSDKEEALSKLGRKDSDIELQYPTTGKDERRLKRGRIALGGASILNGGVEEDNSGVVGGVNAYLWQASLEVLSFMPLISADAVGGVIITDWYQDSAAKGERIKANILITSKELRASGVKVSLFKQKGSGNNWVNIKTSRDAEIKLEDKILTRARELRLQGDAI